ncbi:MAG: nucleoside kinase [Oscillospiraceae bacterium]|jgi:uridine kinase|nr:nucleoside kinase [Oscillospiraceae bacterium]
MSVIHNELDYINALAASDPAALAAQSEARYKNIIALAAEKALGKHAGGAGRTILLAGPSSSGKTTTALRLAQALGARGVQTHRVSLDDFYYENTHMPLLPDGTPDIESVYALDLPLLRATLRCLEETGRADVPHFCFKEGKRTRWDPLTTGPNDLLVLEGLHALNPEITQMAPQALKIYINVSSRIYDGKGGIVLNKRSLRLVRRILRDSQFRGTGAAETIGMWPGVTAGEDRYLSPCKKSADVRVNTIHIYEPCVFAGRVLPLLEEIQTDAPAGRQAGQLAKALRRFAPLPDKIVPKDSLLREFLG